jgi:hypothetical protein
MRAGICSDAAAYFRGLTRKSMVPAVGLEPMWNCIKACVYAALRRPRPALIGTNWYDVVRFVPY